MLNCKMFAPVSHTVPSLKRKESCLNVSVPFSKRSKFSRDLCKTTSDSAVEVEINYKEVEDLSFWDATESKDVEDLTVSDTSESLIEDSNNSLEIYSHVRSKIGYQVECFQLNVSDFFNVLEDDSNVRSLIKENHYQCLKKSKRFFNAVPPIEGPKKINLKYDPHLDECLPNLMSFTDIELSFLREVACGCRPLSWDEYEKSLLIDHGNNSIGFDDCLRDSIVECNKSDKKRKYIIEDLKLFSHNNENELFITEGLNDQAADDHIDLEDPLEVQCNGRSLHTTEISSDEDILPISADELSFLKERMKSFKLSASQQLKMSESKEKLPEADGLSASDDGNNASSGDIIVIEEPPKEKASSKSSSNQAIDFIVDSIDDILKNVNLSEVNSLDLPTSSSNTSKSSMNVDPSTSGAAQLSCNTIEKCSEFVTNMAKGLVISDSDLNALKRLDSKKKEIEQQEKYIEQQEKLIEQQQQQQVSVGEILLFPKVFY
ncbi:hypothetical protein Anas_09125 [Armadillidium nasatum]|uniref:Uncharacterized protein n=1 Tax=Armadillidium nasatum TaxID=96803 RepID=A0A5N5SQG4_9CRUS|nr:hypothetical protein Anas_09125 [Armadillidium nasatum]